jgi:hypothetical protein
MLVTVGTTRRAAQAQYRAFVLDGIDDALAEAVRGQRLGTDALLRDTFGYDPPLAQMPREQIEPLPPSLDEIFTRPSAPSGLRRPSPARRQARRNR